MLIKIHSSPGEQNMIQIRNLRYVPIFSDCMFSTLEYQISAYETAEDPSLATNLFLLQGIHVF